MKTASLEVSRKLAEAGVVVDTYLHWEESPVLGNRVLFVSSVELAGMMTPAPTACELGEALPSVVNGGKLQVAKENDMWDIDYMVEVDYEESYSSLNSWLGPMEDEMADAMGLMLIFLKENGHLEDGK